MTPRERVWHPRTQQERARRLGDAGRDGRRKEWPMPEKREEFVEPEIVKHQEKLAEVTALPAIGSASASDDDIRLN
jgi:hypothetical protein